MNTHQKYILRFETATDLRDVHISEEELQFLIEMQDIMGYPMSLDEYDMSFYDSLYFRENLEYDEMRDFDFHMLNNKVM